MAFFSRGGDGKPGATPCIDFSESKSGNACCNGNDAEKNAPTESLRGKCLISCIYTFELTLRNGALPNLNHLGSSNLLTPSSSALFPIRENLLLIYSTNPPGFARLLNPPPTPTRTLVSVNLILSPRVIYHRNRDVVTGGLAVTETLPLRTQ